MKANAIKELNWGAVCQIYEEGFCQRGAREYPWLSANEQVLRAQEDTHRYLQNEFYCNKGSYYAFWLAEGQWVSAVRIRPYENGLLLDALETAPAQRGKGYAKALLHAVLTELPRSTKVFSRILRNNQASISVHLACGFWKYKPYAKFLDGSFRSDADTYLYEA